MASDVIQDKKYVEFLVVDSGAFIKSAPINDIGLNICTVKEVVTEVVDKNTRDQLQVLPYEIIFREPSTEAIHVVTEFSKKTGDYRSLSAVDLRLLALTYQLQVEKVGESQIRKEPLKTSCWVSSRYSKEKASEIAGFYTSSKKKSPLSDSTGENAKEDSGDADVDSSLSSDGLNHVEDSGEAVSNVNHNNNKNGCGEEKESSLGILQEGDFLPKELLEDEEMEDQQEKDNNCDIEEDDEDDDDEGWITPDNIKLIKKDQNEEKEITFLTVGCLTTDFAMQNVLIQMGLNVVSVGGMLIKQARNYVLWCTACLKICTVMTKLFCPNCGNKTLRKISMSVKEDGSVQYNYSSQRILNHRGTKFALPAPKGGKHSNNPILVEDQRVPQQRPTKKSLQRMCIFDDNYVARSSPFKIHDLTSRAAQLGIKSGDLKPWNKRNPNEVGRKFQKKRK